MKQILTTPKPHGMKQILKTPKTYGKTWEETDRDLLTNVYKNKFVRAECRVLTIGKALCLYTGNGNEFRPCTIARDFVESAPLGPVDIGVIGVIEVDRPGDPTTQVFIWPCDNDWVNKGPMGFKYREGESADDREPELDHIKECIQKFRKNVKHAIEKEINDLLDEIEEIVD